MSLAYTEQLYVLGAEPDFTEVIADMQDMTELEARVALLRSELSQKQGIMVVGASVLAEVFSAEAAAAGRPKETLKPIGATSIAGFLS